MKQPTVSEERRGTAAWVFANPWLGAAVVLALVWALGDVHALLRWVPGYRRGLELVPYYAIGTGRSGLQVLLAVLLLAWLGSTGLRQAARELGFGGSMRQGAAFGFGAAAVMFAGFAATMSLQRPPLFEQAYLAFIAPLAEETVFRGFGVGTLRRRCRLPAWLAVLLPAAVFGALHMEQGRTPVEQAALVLLTGAGGLFFGWFYLRWGGNLWVPFFLHAAMNLVWGLFAVADSALGGWWPFALQFATICAGIFATLRWAPRAAAVAP